MLAPVLAVAGSDDDGSPSKEKKGAEKSAASANSPAAPQVSQKDLATFTQLCNQSIKKVIFGNQKIAALKEKLLDICELKYKNYFNKNQNLTGADAFAMVEQELNIIYQNKDLEGEALLEAFKNLSPQKLFEDEFNRTMQVCEKRINTFIEHKEKDRYCEKNVASNRTAILKICEKLFETWYHDHNNQSEWSVNQLIEERLQLLMTASSRNINIEQLGNPAQSTSDIRKALVQKGQEEQDPHCLDPYSLEGCIELNDALNLSVSQISSDQKNHIKELVAKIERPGQEECRLNEAVSREIFWGKYSDGATLSEENLAYNLLDSYCEGAHYYETKYEPYNASTERHGMWRNQRLQKWASVISATWSATQSDPFESFLALAKVVKYSMNPEKAITEAMQRLQEDLSRMLPQNKKDTILAMLDQDNLHRVLLVGKLPYNLKGLGVVTAEDYASQLSTQEALSSSSSQILGKTFRDSYNLRVNRLPDTLSAAELERERAKIQREISLDMDATSGTLTLREDGVDQEIAFTREDKELVQNLHNGLFYEKTLERLEEMGLISSEQREAALKSEDCEEEASDTLKKKIKEDN